MQLVRRNGLEAGQPVPEIGASADFDQAIAPLKKGEVSAAVLLPNNKIALQWLRTYCLRGLRPWTK